MNERIKELNLQAMSIVMNGNDPDGDIEQMYIPSEFTKKFAELIVRECIAQAVKEEERYDLLDERDCDYCSMAMANFQGVLAKHFGVEE